MDLGKATSIWIAFSIVLGALIVKICLGNPNTPMHGIAIIADVTFILLSLYGLRANRLTQTLFVQAFFFAGFGAYHFFNYDNACYCFSPDSVSSTTSILECLGISASLVLQGLVGNALPSFWRFSLSGIALVLLCVSFLSVTNDGIRPSTEGVDLCSTRNLRLPIFPLNRNVKIPDRGRATVWVLNKNCHECLEFAETKTNRVGELVRSFPEMPAFLIVEQGQKRTIFHCDLIGKNAENSVLIPVKLILNDGVVVACESESVFDPNIVVIENESVSLH